MRARRAAASSLAALALLGLAACGGGGSGESASTQPATTAQDAAGVAAAAAEKTRAAGSSKVAFTTTLTLPGQSAPIEIDGEGAFDYAQQRGTLSLDFGAILDQLGAGALGGEGGTTAEVVFDGGIFYMKLPLLGQLLGGDKPWIEFDLAKLSSGGSAGLGQLAQAGGNDPSQYLAFLQAAGDLREVGTEQVRGVETTHYAGTVALDKVAQAAPADARAELQRVVQQLETRLGTSSLPVDVWIDGDGLVRKIVQTYDAAASGGGSTRVGVELYDFGTDVEVTVPPADQVVDVTELTGLLGGGQNGTTTTP
jgi:hypothetical protein